MVQEIRGIMTLSFILFIYLYHYWSLNSGPCTFLVGTLSLKPCPKPIFAIVSFWIELPFSFPLPHPQDGLQITILLLTFVLWDSWEYRHESSCPPCWLDVVLLIFLFLSRLTSNHNPHDLHLPNHWDYSCKSPYSADNCF
jgi:hypothetical protein